MFRNTSQEELLSLFSRTVRLHVTMLCHLFLLHLLLPFRLLCTCATLSRQFLLKIYLYHQSLAQSFPSVMTPECCQEVCLLGDCHTCLQIPEITSYSFQPCLSITDFMHIMVQQQNCKSIQFHKRPRYLGSWKNLSFLLSHFQYCSISPSRAFEFLIYNEFLV